MPIPKIARLVALQDKLKIMLNHSKDPAFMEAIGHTQRLIHMSEGGKQPLYLVAAMRYIEKLPTKGLGLFSGPTIGEKIHNSKQKRFITSEIYSKKDLSKIDENIKNLPKPELSSTQEHLLAAIQISMMETYQKLWSWAYEYPLDPQSNQVMNDVVGNWQNELLRQLPDKKDEALRDFTRGFTIDQVGGSAYLLNNSTKPDETQIKKDLDQLLSPLKARNQAELYKEYICNLGGQANTSIVTDMLQAEGFGTLGIQVVKANWEMRDGKPTLDCSYNVNGLLDMDNGKLLYKSLEGKTIESEEFEALRLQTEQLTDIKTEQPPMTNIGFSVKLEVSNNQVIPKIADMYILSYTNKLKSPVDQKLEEKEEKELHQTPRPGR